jgi:hypothetical protein
MADGLWVQAAGVEYTAAEDRRLIRALSKAGVVNGLVITATSGTGISVSAGTAIIDAGNGEGYVAYTTAPTTLTLPVSSTTNVYISVNTTTAAVTVTQGSAPAAGTYLLLASVVTSGSGITSTMPITPSTRALPENADGTFLKLTGGVVTGEVQATSLHVPNILQANATLGDVNAPKGVRLGSSRPLSRCYARVYMEAAQNVANGTWTTINMTNASYNYGYQGGAAPFSTSTNRFTCPVTGVYTVMGNLYFSNPSGANTGRRIAAVVRRNSAGSIVWMHQGAQGDGSVTSLAGVTALLDCSAGDTLEIQAYQSQGSTVQVTNGTFAGATESVGTFLLSMPF